jgi:UTP--glucose-1-phosphate uridylyltransferase
VLELASSDLAIVGRYMLTSDIFESIAKRQLGAGGEIQPTDGLLTLSKTRNVFDECEGRCYDLGDRLGYISAQIGFGLKPPDLAGSLRPWLRTNLPRRINPKIYFKQDITN